MNTPISLLVCALGGEGGGVLSEWLMASARLAGLSAQSTSIPGVAQRTGATTYYIEIWPTPLSSTNASAPVFSLNPAGLRPAFAYGPVRGTVVGTLAGEREQGVLAMTLASAQSPAATVFGKFAMHAGAPIFIALLVTMLGVAFFGGESLLMTRDFATLMVVILLYGLFWAALAAAVDGWGKSAAFNALTLIGAWVIVTMIAPAAIWPARGLRSPRSRGSISA